jgi:hypothetical protein
MELYSSLEIPKNEVSECSEACYDKIAFTVQGPSLGNKNSFGSTV